MTGVDTDLGSWQVGPLGLVRTAGVLPGRGCRGKCRGARSRRRADGAQIPTPQAPSRGAPPPPTRPQHPSQTCFSHPDSPIGPRGMRPEYRYFALPPFRQSIRGFGALRFWPARVRGLLGLADDGEALISVATGRPEVRASPMLERGGDDGSGSSASTCGGVYLGPAPHPLASARL